MSTIVDAVPEKFPSCSFSKATSKGEKVKATVNALFKNENPSNGNSEQMVSNTQQNGQDSEEEFPGDGLLQHDQSVELRANFCSGKKRSKKRNPLMWKTVKTEEKWSKNTIQQNSNSPEHDIKTEVGSTSTPYIEEMKNKKVREGAEPYVHQRRESTEPPGRMPGLTTNNAKNIIKKEEIGDIYYPPSECSSNSLFEMVENKTDETANVSQISNCCCDEEEISSNDKKPTLPPFGMPGNIRAGRPGKMMNSQPNALKLKQASHKHNQEIKEFSLKKPVQSSPNKIRTATNTVTIKSLDDNIPKKSVDVTIGTIHSEPAIPSSPIVKTKMLQLESDGQKPIQYFNDLLHNYVTPFIDSHCHLDYIFNKLYNENGKKDSEEIGRYLSEWRNQLQVFPKNFLGCIPNFIDPRLFHKMNEKYYDMDWLQEQVKEPLVLGATYGIHPKYAHIYDDKIEEQLVTFFTNPAYKAVAVGECGLDTCRNFESIEQQKTAFEKQLHLGCKHNLPIVIHCRSDASDETYNTEKECLSIMKKILNPFHTVHRHCFTMDIEVYKMWTQRFPNAYFGFTPFIENATSKQIEAIKNIPLTRILLETDAPFFRPQLYDAVRQNNIHTGPSKTSFPGMAIYTAMLLSRIKEIPLEIVLDITAQNTRRCYGLKEPMYL